MTAVGAEQTTSGDWDEIRSTARTWQYDRYLAATLSARKVRQDLLVLAAFAGDIERICWTVSEPAIAAIRLQWWRDALINADGSSTGHPLADAFRNLIERHQLPLGLIVGHIATQEIELYSDLVDDLDALWLHFQARDGAMFDLAIRVSGGKPANGLSDAVICAGRSYGLAKTLAHLKLRLKARQLLLPADRAKFHGVGLGAVQQTDSQSLKSIVSELSSVATGELARFRQLQGSDPHGLRAPFLPASLIEIYLQFAARQFDAAKASDMEPSPLSKTWRMLMAYLQGRI